MMLTMGALPTVGVTPLRAFVVTVVELLFALLEFALGGDRGALRRFKLAKALREASEVLRPVPEAT